MDQMVITNHTITSNHIATPTATLPDQAFFLSEILGARLMVGGKKVGNLVDLVVKENGTLPVVTHLFVSLPFGTSALIPWDKIGTISPTEIALAADDIAPYRGEPDERAILLKDYILDKKAIDLEGREMEVVYDVRLVLRNNRLYVSEVDLSHYGLLRRIGLKRLADLIYRLADSIRDQTVSWAYIQPLPEDLGRFKGDLRFNVLKEKLADMHPVDLADILEEMDHDQRVELFTQLDPEHASDTLEEIEPRVQRDLVASLKVEKVAQLVDEMTPGQAADILSILSAPEADAILELLEPENARQVRQIMEQDEEKALDYATPEFLMFPPDYPVGQVEDEFHHVAKGKDVAMYVYVVDEAGRLLGVLDIRELLLADEEARLKDVMVDNVVSLPVGSTLKDAAAMFTRYGFRAIPITDDGGKILGVVTYRDVMGLKHRFVE